MADPGIGILIAQGTRLNRQRITVMPASCVSIEAALWPLNSESNTVDCQPAAVTAVRIANSPPKNGQLSIRWPVSSTAPTLWVLCQGYVDGV